MGGPKSLAETVAKGDPLASLIALRDLLAEQLDETQSARDVAALSRRLLEVLARIEAIKPHERSRVDEIAFRRAERRRQIATRAKSAAEGE